MAEEWQLDSIFLSCLKSFPWRRHMTNPVADRLWNVLVFAVSLRFGMSLYQ